MRIRRPNRNCTFILERALEWIPVQVKNKQAIESRTLDHDVLLITHWYTVKNAEPWYPEGRICSGPRLSFRREILVKDAM